MSSRNYIMFVVIFVSLTLLSPAKAVSKFELKTVIEGIDVPWGMVQLPDKNFLVTDRDGTLYYSNIKSQKNIVIKGLPSISARGQGGLLDVELHPEYRKNGWIYLSYSSPDGEGSGDNTAIIRGRLKDFELVDIETIYKASPNSRKRHHYGSRIEFDRDNYLYFSIGDRGMRDENPQDISRDGGKIYRLHDDGRIPKDNPFVNNRNSKPAIYSYGHRNPQGMEMNPTSGKIWIHEHGPKGGDEINVIRKGLNFGWPIITYGVNYIGTKITDFTHKEGMEQPIFHWTPSIAPSGMTFVTSDNYPEWKGHLLVGSLKFSYVVLCRLDGNNVVSQDILFEGIGRTRNVKQMPDGYIYIATENNKIVKVIPK